ncbi:hypothetical protein [Actinotalea sp. Marseille-Q4924]|uniref:hypothetical protein n=1 Tax=Actinotalea sp. Marseille-Q4924 TaxID=2866571 RepID=UPI001CE3FB29|nr:hypothetical protein [Actinotalea sp. Marseille-Q4924]
MAASASSDPRRRRGSLEVESSPRTPTPPEAHSEADLRGVGRFGGAVALGLVGVLVGAVPFLGLLALVESRWEPLHRLDLAVADGLNALVVGTPVVVRVLEVVSSWAVERRRTSSWRWLRCGSWSATSHAWPPTSQ